ncbi:MAG: transposase [Pseudomonadota bacterium]
MGAPCGHRNTRTLTGALALRGMIASFLTSGPIRRTAFEVYVEHMLARERRPGEVVVMDNLHSHKGPHLQALVEAAVAILMVLSPQSSDLHPIERAFATMEAPLRRAAERTVEGPWLAISRTVDIFTPNACENHFCAAGYDP